MRLSKPELFDDRAIHFRFLFPPSNTQAPQWPTLAPNGATKWPQGEHALHRPVYTIRAMDEDVATVDIFHHEGGRTWNWAKSVSAGEEVAIIGPGGNGVLDAADMILAADETAFPAMARMIEALPAGNKSRIVLLSHTDATDYPMPTPSGTTLEWATPDTFANRVEALIADRAPDFLWVGSETAQITKLRKSTAIAEMEKAVKRLAVYWTA
jgi:NADPH-dependent ferric siderophore reductase